MARDGKVVIRPDSGDPVKIVTGYFPCDAYNKAGENETIGNATPEHIQDMINEGFDSIAFYDDGNVTYTLLDQKTILTKNEVKGMVQCLWEIFGGTETSTGYIQLDSHIGAIYGDSITLERATQICERLEAKGFASTNLVYGIGSFTYQGAITPDAIITRDTHGFAVKSTYGEVLVPFSDDVPVLVDGMNPKSVLDLYNKGHRYVKFEDEYYQMFINITGENVVMTKVDGERKGIEIFKDPKTDDGLKKSAKGLIAVYQDADGNFYMKDQATWEEVKNCSFKCVFKNGVLTFDQTLGKIRERVATQF
jgi:nicotinamide phosphoribosyltransferase